MYTSQIRQHLIIILFLSFFHTSFPSVLRYIVEIIDLTLYVCLGAMHARISLFFYYYCCVLPFFHVEGVCSLLRRRTSLLTAEGVLCTGLLLFVCTTQCAQIDATINRPCAQFVFHQSLVFLVSHYYACIHLYITLFTYISISTCYVY